MRVVIVGAGFGGIAAAIELRRHGISDVTILDAARGIGGTWLHNTYPGAACDVPSQLYSYSYEQRKDWPQLCSPQPEILGYIRGVASKHGVAGLVTAGTRVERCAFDDATATWTVEAEDGRAWDADAVIIATGQLHQPAWPKLPGIESFAGRTFHSAEWDHDYDLSGKRVAVVGTGASAVQFVPEIAPRVAKLSVFQRTGNWFYPRQNRVYPPWFRRAVRWIPGLQLFRRGFMFGYTESLTQMIRHPRTLGRVGALRASLFMRWQLRGHPDVRRKVWPHYTFGCKRVLFSSHWLPALTRPNVEVVDQSITAVDATGIVTEDGRHHDADCIIWGTGFQTQRFMFPMAIEGAGGRSLETDAWADGPHAHLGMAVPGFPSLFIMYGPNTNTSGGSIIWYLEQQAAYIRQALVHVRTRDAAAVAVRPDVEAALDREVQDAFNGTAWTECDSWYRDQSGRITTNWPWSMREYHRRVAQFDPAEYELLERPATPADTAAAPA